MDSKHEWLFYIKPEYLRNLSTDIAISTGEQKRAKTFKQTVPSEYHEFADVFAKETFNELPPRHPWDHAIELLPGDHKIDCKTYNLTSVEQKELDEFLEENLRMGCIYPSKSQFASAFFFVKKKDGKLWPVQDYWKLNNITIKNRYPLPLIGELVDKLKSAKYYTKLDIRWGYNNIRMKEGDEWKAAFHTNRGLFELLVMFFGLTNSPATFQTMMNHLFQDLINWGKVVVYMDDIMIFTNTLDDHWKIVKEVLTILRQNKLSLKHTKCEFEVLETEYLGLIVAQGSVRMDKGKVQGVLDWPVPKTKKELRGFLGFLNFYRRFIKDFAQVAKPLNALTSIKRDFEWSSECQHAFDTLKQKIMTAPALHMPTDTDPFHIETDGSGVRLRAILTQKQHNRWHPIAFISKSLSNTERNYPVADLELAIIIFALKEWHHYLLDAKHPFLILTDHKNLAYFTHPQDLSWWQAQWHQLLSEYHFTIEHQPGWTNPADPLSQRPDFEKEVADNMKVTILQKPPLSSAFDPETKARSASNCSDNTKKSQSEEIQTIHKYPRKYRENHEKNKKRDVCRRRVDKERFTVEWEGRRNILEDVVVHPSRSKIERENFEQKPWPPSRRTSRSTSHSWSYKNKVLLAYSQKGCMNIHSRVWQVSTSKSRYRRKKDSTQSQCYSEVQNHCNV